MSETSSSSRYTGINPAQRVAELAGDDFVLSELDELTYKWAHGYEVLKVERENGGGLEYGGTFHPGDGCCSGNPCDYCGKVWHVD